MVLPKGHFKSTEPLDDAGLLAALEGMANKEAKVTAKYEAVKGDLKIMREEREDLRDRIRSALRAREDGMPVFLLKDGKLSVEGPDGQGNLLPAEDMPGPRGHGPAPSLQSDEGEPAAPRRGRKPKAAAGA